MSYSVQQNQFQYPSPQQSSLDDEMNAFILESKQARESQGEAIERITEQMEQTIEKMSEMLQQNPTEELPWQPHHDHTDTYLSDSESDEMDTHDDMTIQSSMNSDYY